MTLTEQVKQKGPWVALVGSLVLLTQFDSGFKLFSSKWNADVQAGEAKKVAVEAKTTAENVDSRFERYLTDQEYQRELDAKLAKQQAEFNQRILELQEQQQIYQQQQVPNQATPHIWWEQTRDGDWYCTDGRDQWWPDADGQCSE